MLQSYCNCHRRLFIWLRRDNNAGNAVVDRIHFSNSNKHQVFYIGVDARYAITFSARNCVRVTTS